MLKLRIDRRAVAGSWWWTGRRWVCGDSWIEPFGHPSLEALACTDGTGRMFVVRERQCGADPVESRTRTVASLGDVSWPKDFVAVTLDARRRCVRIGAGVFGTAPVFMVERDGVLHASWDITDLPLSGAVLNEGEVARLLTLRLRYSAETVFRGVYRVTERAGIETAFTGPPLVRYPQGAAHSAPRSLVADADVIGAYERLLDKVIAGHVYDPGVALVELSGGVDSANIALSLAARTGGHLVRSGAMILDGQRGIQQVQRRRELIGACGFTGPDTIVDTTAHPPLHPNGKRAQGKPVSPYDEPYHEAMAELHHLAARSGVRHVFTGIGGDEMVALRRVEADAKPVGSDRELMPWITPRTREAAESADEGIAPASRINEMTLMAIGCAAPVVLTSGSWPVHPFAHPEMITFGEWLPERWRRGKHLHRERLERRGLGHHIAHPPIPETFTGIMDLGLRDHGVHLARRLIHHGGHLIDSGYVDPVRLNEACDRFTSGTAHPRDREIFDVLALELAIGALTGHRAPVG